MTGQPGGFLNPDDLILADYDLHMGKEFRQPLTTPAPEQAAHVAEIFARSHVDDWDALRACSCCTEDRCMIDHGCPFISTCQTAEG